MDQLSWSADKSSKSRQSETAFERREWPKIPPLKRDKMEVTCCITVIISSAVLMNLRGETLRQTDPLKSEEAEIVKCGGESMRKKKMNVNVVFAE